MRSPTARSAKPPREGVDTLDALTFATGCGACCGSCKPLALQVLDQARTEFDYAFAPAAA
jgi:bacterioferritin-associated ferredoxin